MHLTVNLYEFLEAVTPVVSTCVSFLHFSEAERASSREGQCHISVLCHNAKVGLALVIVGRICGNVWNPSRDGESKASIKN